MVYATCNTSQESLTGRDVEVGLACVVRPNVHEVINCGASVIFGDDLSESLLCLRRVIDGHDNHLTGARETAKMVDPLGSEKFRHSG